MVFMGILRKIENAAFYLFVVVGSYFALNVGMDTVNGLRNKQCFPKIERRYSSDELVDILHEEKKKLGLETASIQLIVDENSKLKGEIGYMVNMKTRELVEGTLRLNPNYSPREIIRHELFHYHRFKQGHGVTTPILRHYEEWIATSYAMAKD